jgi:hypothetical protein
MRFGKAPTHPAAGQQYDFTRVADAIRAVACEQTVAAHLEATNLLYF